jgi:hypothetical protein
MIRVAALVVIVLGFASPARAQRSFDFFGAYLLEHLEEISLHTGVEAGFTTPFGSGGSNTPFDLVGVFSLSHHGLGYSPGNLERRPVLVTNAFVGPIFQSFTLFSVGGGVQRRFAPMGRLTPFARVTAGIQTCCDTTAFYLQPGIGGTVPLSDRVNFYAELALRFLRAEGANAESWRGAFGVSIPLGRN